MKKILASVIIMLFTAVQMVFAQENSNQQQDSDAAVFMSHLRKNWDDIHDVGFEPGTNVKRDIVIY